MLDAPPAVIRTLPRPRATSDPARRSRWLVVVVAIAAALVSVPVVSIAVDVLAAGTGSTWAHLVATVLPEYVRATVVLVLGVGIGVSLLGVGAAWLVTHLDFPLRRSLEWALVLPLAVPAYVMAYAYADWLQYAGPVQSALREAFGWRRGDYWFFEVRSLGGAVVVLSAVLYPYVYLLARVAFLERGGAMMEAGRSLGLTPWQSFLRVSLPMARPAIAGGTALALMETLSDYGTVSYFGVQTFTTGIVRAWFSLGDRAAAAQLSMCLLGFVVFVLAAERAARGRARFYGAATQRRPPQSVRLRGGRAALAMVACALPLIVGFALPAGLLLKMALADGDPQFGLRFATLAGHSLLLSSSAAVAAVTLAVAFAYARRTEPRPLTHAAHAVAGLGYAFPGTVIAVGVLIPLAQLDNALALWLREHAGWEVGLIFTGSIAALVYACVIRFLASALHTVDAALARITPSMDDAARSLGLTATHTLGRVHLPLLRRSLLTAGLLVFIDVMKELPATLVMRPFNFDTLATQAFQLASDERLAEAATASIAIVVVGLLPLVLLSRQITTDRR